MKLSSTNELQKTVSFSTVVINPKGDTDEETMSFVKHVFEESIDEYLGKGFCNGVCTCFRGRYKDRAITLAVEIEIDLIPCNYNKDLFNIRKLKMVAIIEAIPGDDLASTWYHFASRLKMDSRARSLGRSGNFRFGSFSSVRRTRCSYSRTRQCPKGDWRLQPFTFFLVSEHFTCSNYRMSRSAPVPGVLTQ